MVVFGSSNSSKSYSVHQNELIRIMREHEKGDTLILRKHGVDIRESSFKLINNLISEWGLTKFFKAVYSNESRKITYLPTGRAILFKGLDDSERIKSIVGVKRIVMEEASEFVLDDFMELTRRARGFPDIQFTLILNPVSEKHWIKKNLCDPDGAYRDKTDILKFTYKDNKFCTAEDIEVLEDLKKVSENQYRIYALGEWGIEDKQNKFAWAFSHEKHVSKTALQYNSDHPIYLSFDFNVNPVSCLAAQHYNETFYCLKSFKLETSDIYKMCEVIMSTYPGALVIVTGDATGRGTSALVKDGLNYYKVIRQQMGLIETQIQVPNINPSLTENKLLVNAVLQTVDVAIDPKQCDPLIYDLTYVEVDVENKIIKDRANEKRKADALDTFRYLCNKLFKHILRLPK